MPYHEIHNNNNAHICTYIDSCVKMLIFVRFNNMNYFLFISPPSNINFFSFLFLVCILYMYIYMIYINIYQYMCVGLVTFGIRPRGAVLLSNLTHSTSRQVENRTTIITIQLRGKSSKTVPHVCWHGGGIMVLPL